jgi:hypothetical protein
MRQELPFSDWHQLFTVAYGAFCPKGFDLMMTSINMSPQANRGQFALASAILERYSLNKDIASAKAAPQEDDEFLIVSFSKAGKKLLQEQRDAEIKEKMRQVLKAEEAKTERLAEQSKAAKKEADAKKIGELKAQLKELVARLRQALMFGDKRGAAAIAKEAASLAKSLAIALKDSDSSGGGDSDSIAVPTANAEGPQEAAEATDANEAGEAGENANAENGNTGKAEAGAAGQIGAAKLLAKGALDKTKDVSFGAEDKDELKQIVAILKTVVSALKTAKNQKNGNPEASMASSPSQDSHHADEIQRDIEEIEDAIKNIESAE